jgi:hypothetical protein
MIELLMGWILRCPRCAAGVGSAVLGAGAFMLAMGFRIDKALHRIARVFDRAGAAAPTNLRDSWPWWLNLAVPEGFFDYAFAFVLVAVGIALLTAARWASKFER